MRRWVFALLLVITGGVATLVSLGYVPVLGMPLPGRPVITLTKSSFGQGESVEFKVNAPIRGCSEVPYRILRDGEPLELEPGCIGYVGHGIGEYCANGQIATETSRCSDVPGPSERCAQMITPRSYSWNQREYVPSTAENGICGGKVMKGDIGVQVPAGRYEIVVVDATGHEHRSSFVIR